MRPSRLVATALGAGVFLTACNDAPQVTPLAPMDPMLARSAECSGPLASTISKDQKDLYSGAALTTAQDLFKVIKDGCPNTKQEMLGYIQFTINQLPTPRPAAAGTYESNLTTHWQRLFSYVGYVGVDVPPNSAANTLASTGGAAVFDLASPEDTLLTVDEYAGVRVPGQATLTGSRLFTIEQTPGTCFVTNLQRQGGCYTYGIYPHTTGFNPKLMFGICESTTPDITGKSLGHKPENGPFVVLTAQVPGFCPDAHASASATWLRQHGPLGRVLAAAIGALAPRPLYAVHGGLGGEDDAASPVGGVATITFYADFSNDGVGQQPGAPQSGTWSAENAPPPGTILVQSSIGDPVDGLTDKPVVLSQAGGNCASCGTLQLQGTMFNSGAVAANAGTYEVRWNSLQDKPSVKDAPIVLRGANGREIARLSYRTVSSDPRLFYTGPDGKQHYTGCNWTQSASQHFVVTVDVDNKKTSLQIAGCSTQIADSTQNISFPNPKASDLASVGWELSGIDAGIIGWDDVEIVRLADIVP